MNGKRIRITIDAAMTVLFLLQMAYHIEGNAVHEWVGFILFLLFVIHSALNGKWYRNLFHGGYPPVRLLMTAVNLLLLAAMLGAAVSGMLLSRDVFGFLNLRAGMFGRRLHMISTAWVYPLMAMHLGLHWGILAGKLKRRFPVLATGKGQLTMKLLVLLLSAAGIRAFAVRQFPAKMFLQMEYAFFDYEEPAVLFFADYLCILILFAAAAYGLSDCFKIKSNSSRRGQSRRRKAPRLEQPQKNNRTPYRHTSMR